jgi:hypothetical protein
LDSPADIIRVTKVRRMRWVRHAVRIGEMMQTKYELENLKGRDHLEDLGKGGWIVLKCVFNKYVMRIADLIHVGEDR